MPHSAPAQVALLGSTSSDTTVSLSHRGSPGSAPRAFSLAGLLAKDVGGKQAQQALAAAVASAEQQPTQQQLLYVAEWQAAGAAPDAAAPERLPLLSAVVSSGRLMCVAGAAGEHPTASAQQVLQALQHSGANGLNAAKQWLLGGASDAPGLPAPANASRRAAADSQAAASLHGLLKVAAAEQLIAADAAVALGSRALPTAAQHSGSHQFGTALQAGVLTMPQLLPSPAPPAAVGGPCTSSYSGTVLINGGLGGLGLLAAEWLQQASRSEPGAHLMLLGRSGRSMDSRRRSSGGSTAGAGSLTTGAPKHSRLVSMTRCDVAATEEAAAAVAAAAQQQVLGPVLHAGGVLADALLLNQSAASLRTVAAPKLAGLQRLSAAAAHQPMAQLLLFSSIAGELGTVGQGNYAAANAALDAAAVALQQQGCASTSVQWGAWAGAGMAASTPALLVKLQRRGYAAVQPAAGLAALHGLMVSSCSGAAVVMAAPFDWGRFLAPAGRRQTWQGTAALPYFAAVQPAEAAEPPTAAQAAPPAAAPAAAPAAEAVLPVVQQMLEEQLGSSTAAVDVALDAPFLQAGLDSIGAVELRWVGAATAWPPSCLAWHWPPACQVTRLHCCPCASPPRLQEWPGRPLRPGPARHPRVRPPHAR